MGRNLSKWKKTVESWLRGVSKEGWSEGGQRLEEPTAPLIQGGVSWAPGLEPWGEHDHFLLPSSQLREGAGLAKGPWATSGHPPAWNLARAAKADAALLRRDRAGAQAQPKKEAAPQGQQSLCPWPSPALAELTGTVSG